MALTTAIVSEMESELAAIEKMLSNPAHRPFPFKATEVGALLNVSPQYVRNLANRSHTGVKRYSGGYDLWEVKRWMLRQRVA